MHIDAPRRPQQRCHVSGRGIDPSEPGHGGKASTISGRCTRGHPERAGGSDDVDSAHADLDRRLNSAGSGSSRSRSVPRPVTQSDPADHAIRSGVSPGTVVSRAGLVRRGVDQHEAAVAVVDHPDAARPGRRGRPAPSPTGILRSPRARRDDADDLALRRRPTRANRRRPRGCTAPPSRVLQARGDPSGPGSIRESVPPRRAPRRRRSADRTAIGWPQRRDRAARRAAAAHGRRAAAPCTRPRQTPWRASVCVGQYGPAPAHDRLLRPRKRGGRRSDDEREDREGEFHQTDVYRGLTTVNGARPNRTRPVPETSLARARAI